jgi:hypothetical protein
MQAAGGKLCLAFCSVQAAGGMPSLAFCSMQAAGACLISCWGYALASNLSVCMSSHNPHHGRTV